ncbi:hypothetical protein Dda_8571 [Drechslerella dactyloides]|uniref:Uncharacterized protein n=1 Tax=Drechslerella dactyloides TaxID=74499 RepID=A0AAD6NFS6_DREDA|nr:hypothetical protein Dda_8571 [Drechslerella dactyloides]
MPGLCFCPRLPGLQVSLNLGGSAGVRTTAGHMAKMANYEAQSWATAHDVDDNKGDTFALSGCISQDRNIS